MNRLGRAPGRQARLPAAGKPFTKLYKPGWAGISAPTLQEACTKEGSADSMRKAGHVPALLLGWRCRARPRPGSHELNIVIAVG